MRDRQFLPASACGQLASTFLACRCLAPMLARTADAARRCLAGVLHAGGNALDCDDESIVDGRHEGVLVRVLAGVPAE